MAEPKSKKIKVDEKLMENVSEMLPKSEPFPRKTLEEMNRHLEQKCLCKIELSVIKDALIKCNKSLTKPNLGLCTTDDLLIYTSMLSLFFEISVKQQQEGNQCASIAGLVCAGASIKRDVVNDLFLLLSSENKFISYNAGRAMTSLLLLLKDSKSRLILQKLARNLTQSKNLLEISHTLNIIQRIIDWKDMDEHPLELTDEDVPSTCKRLSIPEVARHSSNSTKASATKCIEQLWPKLTYSLVKLIVNYSQEKEHVVVSFFSLWESILSVKANLSIINVKVFYSGLDKLLVLLKCNTSSLIWRRVIDLYNEFLCYGSTLALQDASDESCNIANLIIAAIKYKHFLEDMPWNETPIIADVSPISSNVPTNLSSEADLSNVIPKRPIDVPEQKPNKILLHRLVLLVLKAIALAVKESKYESSSDSSHSDDSGTSTFGASMIEKNICGTLKMVDKFVKSKVPFHPESSIAEWIIHLFANQDDWLIEAMLCCLDIYNGGLWQSSSESVEAGKRLNPHETFARFASAVHFDHDVFLDFLVSNETCFLLYLLRYLKFLKRNWLRFRKQDDRTVHKVMSLFINLRLAIERLVGKKLFPYDITPILRLLDYCEDAYERCG